MPRKSKSAAYDRFAKLAAMHPAIDVSSYRIEELDGIKSLLEFVSRQGDPVAVELSGVDNTKEAYGNLCFSSYGDRLDYVKEAFVFQDGRVLCCATVSSWGGSFQSHDDIRVKYYGLTPP